MKKEYLEMYYDYMGLLYDTDEIIDKQTASNIMLSAYQGNIFVIRSKNSKIIIAAYAWFNFCVPSVRHFIDYPQRSGNSAANNIGKMKYIHHIAYRPGWLHQSAHRIKRHLLNDRLSFYLKNDGITLIKRKKNKFFLTRHIKLNI